MTWLVQTRLINGPFSDPGLFIDFRFARRALLFDLGDVSALASRELLRVSHVFVSHAHMDHFFGFDMLLRVCLHRGAPLHLIGPSAFGDRVAAKLDSYTWNLLDETSVDFAIIVDEFDGRMQRRWRFCARKAFVREELEAPLLAPSYVLQEEEFSIEAAVLDHGTPSLAFALQERMRVNVWRDGLARLGLPVGPWLNAAKRAVRRGDPADAIIVIEEGKTVTLGKLEEEALCIAPGQRIAYVVDAAAHDSNIERAARLVRDADRLYIEAPFANDEAGLAQRRRHLTAAVAGEIAKRGGVRQVIPFHFSPRYVDRPDLIPQQVNDAFRANLAKNDT
jgi:ribonuclease Z